MDPIERVHALMARTQSSEIEEARTSALIACQTIIKHNLRIVDPAAAPTHVPPPATSRATPASSTPRPRNFWDILFEGLEDAAHASVQRSKKTKSSAQRRPRGSAEAVNDFPDEGPAGHPARGVRCCFGVFNPLLELVDGSTWSKGDALEDARKYARRSRHAYAVYRMDPDNDDRRTLVEVIT